MIQHPLKLLKPIGLSQCPTNLGRVLTATLVRHIQATQAILWTGAVDMNPPLITWYGDWPKIAGVTGTKTSIFPEKLVKTQKYIHVISAWKTSPGGMTDLSIMGIQDSTCVSAIPAGFTAQELHAWIVSLQRVPRHNLPKLSRVNPPPII